MTHEELKHIKADRRLKVRYGQRGTQVARFCRWSNSQHGIMLMVEKFSVRKNAWTKPVRIFPAEVLAIY